MVKRFRHIDPKHIAAAADHILDVIGSQILTLRTDVDAEFARAGEWLTEMNWLKLISQYNAASEARDLDAMVDLTADAALRRHVLGLSIRAKGRPSTVSVAQRRSERARHYVQLLHENWPVELLGAKYNRELADKVVEYFFANLFKEPLNSGWQKQH